MSKGGSILLNYIWSILLFIAVIVAVFTGEITTLSDSVIKGAADSVELLLSITGIVAFWSGIMEVAEKSGLMQSLCNLFRPILSKVFNNASSNKKAMEYICSNITANMLGLGNAATPLGLKAMNELQKMNRSKNTASNDMITFVVLNTASLQILPTTLCAYRSAYGSTKPFEILPQIWLVSLLSLTIGLLVTKMISKNSGG